MFSIRSINLSETKKLDIISTTAEFLGTFAYVVAGLGGYHAILVYRGVQEGGVADFVSVLYGVACQSVVYGGLFSLVSHATGEITGLFNPVLVCLLLKKTTIGRQRMFLYLASQFSGSIIGVFVLKVIIGVAPVEPSTMRLDLKPGEILRTLMNFTAIVVLCFICATQLAGTEKFKKHAPIVIPAVFFTCSLVNAYFGGTSLNFAQYLAVETFHSFQFSDSNDASVYVIGSEVGLAFAFFLHFMFVIRQRFLRGDFKDYDPNFVKDSDV